MTLLGLLLACAPPAVGLAGGGDDGAVLADDTGPGEPEVAPGATCPSPADLYDPACVVRYDVEIAEADWAAMQSAYDRAVA